MIISEEWDKVGSGKVDSGIEVVATSGGNTVNLSFVPKKINVFINDAANNKREIWEYDVDNSINFAWGQSGASYYYYDSTQTAYIINVSGNSFSFTRLGSAFNGLNAYWTAVG